ncbi:FecR family protein [Pedobacter antarcticus]|uniref:FecR family protein n=1 Tax=Pedobacter antarcticus TaxID=34086 RepID=UPI0029301F8E|nr:FecR domain-containing protein [Pedobacter antarcticus]
MQKDIKAILDKMESGDYTPEEEAIAKYWLHQLHLNDEAGITEKELEEVSAQIWSSLPVNHPNKLKNSYLWQKLSAAAAILIVLGTVLYLYTDRFLKETHPEAVYIHDIHAGGNKAYLTLSNGKKITLTDAMNGQLATESGVQITKAADGQLVYIIADQKYGTRPEYNLIETPKGGQYQIRLPDGTNVWLNAASSLKYPTSFQLLKERRVELMGEAYFEVSKDKKHPFTVTSPGQEIKVLGTHFSINAYTDEPVTRTTLLEGIVKVNNQVTLKPGEQAVYRAGNINVAQVNANDAIDWKNGEFIFTNESLANILRRVSRWYNVQIIYVKPQTDLPTFTGSVSRFENVSAVLKMLEETSNVRFAIEGKTIKVL